MTSCSRGKSAVLGSDTAATPEHLQALRGQYEALGSVYAPSLDGVAGSSVGRER